MTKKILAAPLIAATLAVGYTLPVGTQHCRSLNALPDRSCTPGYVTSATRSQVCTPGYATSVRNVTQGTKNAVYASYGVRVRLPGQYEVDHLVPLSLGGSNDPRNLWPEPAEPRPGFHEKDVVEWYLYR